MSKNNFPLNWPLPNWPKPEFLKKEKFDKYCTVVNQAIIDWLERNRKTSIRNKFLSSNRWKLTNKEMKIISSCYSEQTDLILMKSWY